MFILPYFLFGLIHLLSFLSSSVADDSYESFTQSTPMPYAVSDMTATIFEDLGRVYLVGGCTQNQDCSGGSASCYCPKITSDCHYFRLSDETWNTCSPAPTARFRHMAARVGNYLIISGGRSVNDRIITSIERYDVVNDVWDVRYDWADATSDGVAFSVGTNYYVAGGYNKDYTILSNNLTMIDTTKTGISAFSQKAKMRVGRGDIAVTENGGYFYVLGGWNVSTGFCDALATTEAYDPITDTWKEVHPMLYKRGDMAAGVMGGNIFSIGGETKDSTCDFSVPVSNVGRYNAIDNTWQLEQSIPMDLFRFVAVSVVNTDSPVIYLFGGQGAYEPGIKQFPLKYSTIKYVPKSQSKTKKLSDGSIAGIAIGVAVFLGILLLLALTYIGYLRRAYSAGETVNLVSDVTDPYDEETQNDGKAKKTADQEEGYTYRLQSSFKKSESPAAVLEYDNSDSDRL